MTPELRRIRFAPSTGHVHLWEVRDGETDHLFACDEVCHDGHCIDSDSMSGERTVTLEDLRVERQGDHVTVHFEGVVTETDSFSLA